MNPGLRYLLAKGPLRQLRHVARRTRGTRRRVLSVVGGLVMLAIVGWRVFLFFAPWRGEVASLAEPGFRLWGPLVLAMLALLGIVVGYGLHFRPAEIDWLFPAPLSRRELVLYNVIARLGVGAMSSLWLALFLANHAPNPWAGAVAVVLIVVFLQWVAKLSVLILTALSVQVRTRSPYLAPLVILAMFAGISVASTSRVKGGVTVSETVERLSHTPLGRVLTAPTRPFFELFLAHDGLAFGSALAAVLAILGAMLAAILALDVSFQESAVRVTQEMEARLTRMRSGGSLYTSVSPARGRFSLPVPRRRWGGVGPIAWRQATEALRNVRGLATGIGTMLTFALLPVILVRGDRSVADSSAIRLVIGIVVLATLNVTQQFPFDFRRDLDRLPLLKTLPLSPSAVALGQLLPMVLVFSAVHLFVAGVVIVLSGMIAVKWWLAVAIAIVPFNCVHIALDNALFLLMPQRFELKDTGGFRAVDRLGIMLVKGPVLVVAGGLALVLGNGAYQLAGGSVAAAGVGAAAAFACVAVPIVQWVGRLFARFDIPRDTPE